MALAGKTPKEWVKTKGVRHSLGMDKYVHSGTPVSAQLKAWNKHPENWELNNRNGTPLFFGELPSPSAFDKYCTYGEIFMFASKLQEIRNKKEDGGGHFHREIGERETLLIESVLADPFMILKSNTEPNRIIVYGDAVARNGLPMLVVVEPTPADYYNTDLCASLVASAYTKNFLPAEKALLNSAEFKEMSAKEKYQAYVQTSTENDQTLQFINDSEILAVNKEKTPSWFKRSLLKSHLRSNLESTISIAEDMYSVNMADSAIDCRFSNR